MWNNSNAQRGKSIHERYWEKVRVEPDGCHMWLAAKEGCGYGQFWTGRAIVRVHAYAWMLANGRWPDQHVLHTCDRPACVNPAHLFLGNHADNMRDAARKGRLVYPCCRGERHGAAVLTEKIVLELRAAYAAGGISQHKLAQRYGLARTTVYHVLARDSWRHI